MARTADEDALYVWIVDPKTSVAEGVAAARWAEGSEPKPSVLRGFALSVAISVVLWGLLFVIARLIVG